MKRRLICALPTEATLSHFDANKQRPLLAAGDGRLHSINYGRICILSQRQ